jgi:hypothetical protein
MSKRSKLFAIAATAVLAAGVGTYAFTASSQEGEHGFGPRSSHGMGRGTMGPGMMGGGMMRHGPMAGSMGIGRDRAASADLDAIHELVANHDGIRRTVTNLPDGIRTVTESDDPRMARLIKEHVARMGERVRSGRMLGVPIESPAVHAIYENKDKIRTSAEPTATGVVVIQTSTDPKVVALLQEHAVEVSELVRGGMAMMHAAMMRGMHGMSGMMGGMHRGGRMMHGGMMHDAR